MRPNSCRKSSCRSFADGLREVSTATWRQALEEADAPVPPELLEADALDAAPLVQP